MRYYVKAVLVAHDVSHHADKLLGEAILLIARATRTGVKPRAAARAVARVKVDAYSGNDKTPVVVAHIRLAVDGNALVAGDVASRLVAVEEALLAILVGLEEIDLGVKVAIKVHEIVALEGTLGHCASHLPAGTRDEILNQFALVVRNLNELSRARELEALRPTQDVASVGAEIVLTINLGLKEANLRCVPGRINPITLEPIAVEVGDFPPPPLGRRQAFHRYRRCKHTYRRFYP